MKAIYTEYISKNADDKEVVRALVLSDTTPAALPTTGAGIDGMNADQVFAPLSMIYVAADVDTKLYLADESGEFIPQ
jgi:hypothetical protein